MGGFWTCQLHLLHQKFWDEAQDRALTDNRSPRTVEQARVREESGLGEGLLQLET